MTFQEKKALIRRHSSFHGRFGVGRVEATPSVGVYCRNWGAAVHDVAESIHRPLMVHALAIEPLDSRRRLVFVENEICVWRDHRMFETYRRRLLDAFSLDASQLIVTPTHTHAGAALVGREPPVPGSELVAQYLETLCQRTIEAIALGVEHVEPARLEWHWGRCQLAAMRDLPDPTPGADRVLCGYNPNAMADDALLVGRVTANEGRPLATLVNYACHPTTLAWENRSISPDFVGAMRDVIERQVGAPTLFMQGAAAELAPRYQYVADPAVADRHGRQLGFATLATLEDMEPPGLELVFDRVVESGAPLAVWRHRPAPIIDSIHDERIEVDVPLREWPSAAELERMRLAENDRVAQERLRRKRDNRLMLGDGDSHPMPLAVWRLGDAIVVGVPVEAYSDLQIELRRRFPDLAIVCMNLANGSGGGYLPPADRYDMNIYQVERTPFARGGLERVVAALTEAIARVASLEPVESRPV
jgi:hypothetical protein